jgi:FHA domain
MMDNSDSGIFCPACKMKNESGAYTCIYCNTPLRTHSNQQTILLRSLHEVTGILSDSYDEVLNAPAPATEPFMDFEIPSKGIALINLENGQLITTRLEKTFILGRVSTEIKTNDPLVDLTQFGGLELGISRIHAMIRLSKDGYQIIDMESSNGTWLENQRLVPKQPYPLESGDRIRVGRLNILVFYIRDL